MRKIILIMTLGLASLLTDTALPTTAFAVDDLRVHASAADVTVRKGSCSTAHIHGFGNWSATDNATVSIVVRTPRGRKFREFEFGNSTGSFDRSVRMCYAATPGVYSVAVSVTLPDTAQSARTSTSYRMTRVIPKKRSRIAVRTGRITGQGQYKYAAFGTLYRSGNRYPGQRVWLIARANRGWVKVDSAVTGRNGRRRGLVGWYFKPNTTRWALWYAGDAHTRPSASDPFRFPGGREQTAARLAELRSLVRER